MRSGTGARKNKTNNYFKECQDVQRVIEISDRGEREGIWEGTKDSQGEMRQRKVIQ